MVSISFPSVLQIPVVNLRPLMLLDTILSWNISLTGPFSNGMESLCIDTLCLKENNRTLNIRPPECCAITLTGYDFINTDTRWRYQLTTLSWWWLLYFCYGGLRESRQATVYAYTTWKRKKYHNCLWSNTIFCFLFFC